MGIFHMFKHSPQVDAQTKVGLYKLKHEIGLELHHSRYSSLNYLAIGGYNEDIVKEKDNIMWATSYCNDHWEILIQSLKFSDSMIMES
mmetsp:Transcript_10286/g.15681  ORF Transcript_10286/g.15681 Transcript_10286/m.15681 type:complete len:88 (+) Transcript_10286:655-918(+)